MSDAKQTGFTVVNHTDHTLQIRWMDHPKGDVERDATQDLAVGSGCPSKVVDAVTEDAALVARPDGELCDGTPGPSSSPTWHPPR
jgi:hypothetical protein